ncbi:adaptor protein MecA [Liquorilactobacillus oeni]|uniref:Adapter protein MecA n=1 Tax=Liquorilactobacillus oeni DSM 19972 TaxID=1423777 RepID=A0A0R1M8X7_9LACO|nr:adaptor protein MecA [Liquorilactobacillus oeni]KRL04797.1 adaptor protein [Liquorilactobacillus oeni DSM 19972]
MEMEKINDNTIRVLLETDDLTERGITVLDLLGNHKEIENFFYSILEEVDVDHEFRENDAVTFQLLPNRNGLELFISKVNPKDSGKKQTKENNGNTPNDLDFSLLGADEDVSEYIKHELTTTPNKQKGTVADDGDGVSGYLSDKNTEKKHYVVEFTDFEDFVQVSKVLRCENVASSLYFFKDKYYLDLVFFVEQISDSQIKDVLSLVVEYGKRVNLSVDVLQERAKIIFKTSAFELARYYFK